MAKWNSKSFFFDPFVLSFKKNKHVLLSLLDLLSKKKMTLTTKNSADKSFIGLIWKEMKLRWWFNLQSNLGNFKMSPFGGPRRDSGQEGFPGWRPTAPWQEQRQLEILKPKVRGLRLEVGADFPHDSYMLVLLPFKYFETYFRSKTTLCFIKIYVFPAHVSFNNLIQIKIHFPWKTSFWAKFKVNNVINAVIQ